MSNSIPFDIVTNICRYIPDQYFINTLIINKDIYDKLKNDIFIRKNNSIINRLIYEKRCLSNIDLGNKNRDLYRCSSTRDEMNGSVFCKFCNYISSKTELKAIH